MHFVWGRHCQRGVSRRGEKKRKRKKIQRRRLELDQICWSVWKMPRPYACKRLSYIGLALNSHRPGASHHRGREDTTLHQTENDFHKPASCCEWVTLQYLVAYLATFAVFSGLTCADAMGNRIKVWYNKGSGYTVRKNPANLRLRAGKKVTNALTVNLQVFEYRSKNSGKPYK